MKKDTKIYLTLVVIVIIIIAGVYIWKNILKEQPKEKLMKCIASKAVLYGSKTCSHCKAQKEILGKYLSLFKEIDCFYEIDECNKANISAYPTWIIDGKQYLGVKSINELKEITGCE